MLLRMDGFTACRKLREQIDTPVLMVTAKREDIDKIRDLGPGTDDYIEKLFSPGVLVARIKANMAQYERLKGSREQQPEINTGSTTVDTRTRRVFAYGNEVSLKNKEYELLVFLMINATPCSAVKNFMKRSVAWTPCVTMPQLRYTPTA